MDCITATELELLGCFGVEPQLRDSVVWFYNEANYSVVVGEYTVSFTLQPSYRDVSIRVWYADRVTFELTATSVTDVRVIDETGIDTVEIQLTPYHLLTMQLRPFFQITQRFVPNL